MMLEGTIIWDRPHPLLRPELCNLIRFKDHWYCGFREAQVHHDHPSGSARIIRSADGRQWQSVALFSWDAGDVREPKFSVTAENCLMVNTSVSFVSREPRPVPGKPGTTAYFQLEGPGESASDREQDVIRQSVTWLSSDGLNWSSAYACPTGTNCWRWEVVWFNGMGYSVGYGRNGHDRFGTLYRTRDGKTFRTLTSDFFPGGQGNEASLAFDHDGTAYCLLRDAGLRSPAQMDAQLSGNDGHEVHKSKARRVYGAGLPMFGISKGPYYQQWTWKPIEVDYGPEYGGVRPAEDLFLAPLGGPQLRRLSDGRFIASGRMLSPGRDDGHITLFLLDPHRPRLTFLAECTGSTYGGIVEHDGRIWVTHITARHLDKIDVPGDERIVHLASIPVPK